MSNIVNTIFEVFSIIGVWIVDQLGMLTELFWIPASSGDGGSLTFLGVLALCSLGISVIFLLIRVVQNFLHFRG